MLTTLRDHMQGKVPWKSARSGHWPTTRKKFLARNPQCVVCGGTKKLEVHHIKPFHLHPGLELNESNLITLCESGANGANCHLLWGHLGNFKSFNINVREDCIAWVQKLKARPLPK